MKFQGKTHKYVNTILDPLPEIGIPFYELFKAAPLIIQIFNTSHSRQIHIYYFVEFHRKIIQAHIKISHTFSTQFLVIIGADLPKTLRKPGASRRLCSSYIFKILSNSLFFML